LPKIRLLRLIGYELYRFGGAEFRDANLVDDRYSLALRPNRW